MAGDDGDTVVTPLLYLVVIQKQYISFISCSCSLFVVVGYGASLAVFWAVIGGGQVKGHRN